MTRPAEQFEAERLQRVFSPTKNIFELALNDWVICRSPYAGVTNKRQHVTMQPDAFRSPEQFERIIEAICH
jgi:hypothetical protein